jgi:hypothetical protein
MLLLGFPHHWISSVQTNKQEQHMRVTQIIADLHVLDLPAAKGFYTEYLGLVRRSSTWDGWRATPHPTPESVSK